MNGAKRAAIAPGASSSGRLEEADMTSPGERAEALPPLVLIGDPRLAQPCAPVDPAEIPTLGFQEKLRLLFLGLKHHRANGIAAPQLGWFQRFLLMRDPSTRSLVTWINPVVSATTEQRHWTWEGCLSVPGMRAYIGRPAAVTVTGLDGNGAPLSREFGSWEAHLYHHEHDHLDGLLFTHRTEDPNHLVRAEEFERRHAWPPDWPAAAAREAPAREFPEGEDAYFEGVS